MALGVPSADITLDYAGFSTYESCYRARDIFGVRTVICRIYDPLREAIFGDLGLETICPTLWAAERIQAILEK